MISMHELLKTNMDDDFTYGKFFMQNIYPWSNGMCSSGYLDIVYRPGAVEFIKFGISQLSPKVIRHLPHPEIKNKTFEYIDTDRANLWIYLITKSIRNGKSNV